MGLPARLVAATNSNDAASAALERRAAARRRRAVPYRRRWTSRCPTTAGGCCTPRRADASCAPLASGFPSRTPRAAGERAGGSRRVRSAPVDDDETLRTMRLVHAAGGRSSTRTRPSASPPLRERSASEPRQCAWGARTRASSRPPSRALGVDDAAALRAVLSARRRRAAASRPSPRWRAPHEQATRPASTRRPAARGCSAEEATGSATLKAWIERVEREGVAAVTGESL